MIVLCMSLICGARFFLCDDVCLFVCLCYGVYVLLVYRLHWFVLCVMLNYVLAFLFACGVYVVFVVCCSDVCCCIGLSCVYVWLLWFRFRVCVFVMV